jgi:hypothetical protein
MVRIKGLDTMARALCLLSIALCLSLGGCNRASVMKRMTPREDESFARKYVDLLRQQSFEQVEKDLDPSIANSDIGEKLAAMTAMFPAGEPKSVKVVALTFRRGAESQTDTLGLEYEFPDKWLLVDISIQRAGGVSTIVGFHVTPIADSLENVNRFSLAGKSALQYAVLLIAAAVPIFCLYVLFLCLQIKTERRKWLWAVFILLGVGKLAVNWTTGEWTFTPLAVNLLGASVTVIPAYGPWMVAVAFPLGAILFFRRQRRSVALAEVQASSTEEQTPSN